jgi:integrase
MIIRRGKKFIVRLWIPDPSKPRGRRMDSFGSFDTRREAQTAEAQALLQREQMPRGTHHWTVRQFAARWLARYHGEGTRRPTESTLRHNEDAIRAFLKLYGDRRLADFKPNEARDFAGEFTWRTKAVAAMFEDAIRDGKILANPFASVRRPKGEGRKNIDPLTAAEVDRLAEIARETLGWHGPHFAAFILTAAWTGMRPGELCRLEWRDIDWQAGEIDVRETKTKVDRRIVLAPAARRALESLHRDGDLVFHTVTGKPLRAGSYLWSWHKVRAVFEAELPADHWLPRRLRKNPDDHLDPYEARHFMRFVAGESRPVGAGHQRAPGQLGAGLRGLHPRRTAATSATGFAGRLVHTTRRSARRMVHLEHAPRAGMPDDHGDPSRFGVARGAQVPRGPRRADAGRLQRFRRWRLDAGCAGVRHRVQGFPGG